MTRLSAVLWERPRRTAILALAIAAGMLFIGILTLALPAFISIIHRIIPRRARSSSRGIVATVEVRA